MHVRSFPYRTVGPCNESSLPLQEHLVLDWCNHHHRPLHCRFGDRATGKKQVASCGEWGNLANPLMAVTTSIPESGVSLHVCEHWEDTCSQIKDGTWTFLNLQITAAHPVCSGPVPAVYSSSRKIKGTSGEPDQKCQGNGGNRGITIVVGVFCIVCG